MQDLVGILLEACTTLGDGASSQLKQQLNRSASLCLEDYYRSHSTTQSAGMTTDDYARLVEQVACGGHIRGRVSTDKHNRLRLVHSDCPLGTNPEMRKSALCQAATDLLGEIASRNFGYAKVSIDKQRSKQFCRCEFVIHLDRDGAVSMPGQEYFAARQDAGQRPESAAGETDSVAQPSLPYIVAHSAPIKQLLNAVDIIAPTTATVLITGETGVGKELIARRLHCASDRAAEEFVAVNCGAIPEDLADSALFGHEKGAFTGAREQRKGYFERADNGTLFLDEINSLPASTQGRLLRVLQEGEYDRVGGRQTRRTNARVVVASNASLEEAVQRGDFRKDLWFRLNIIDLHVPPLRENRENIPHLVDYFLEKLQLKYGKRVDVVSDHVMRQLYDYSWPGNVRELQNVLERSFIFAAGEILEDIQLNSRSSGFSTQADPCGMSWQDYKQDLIEQAEKDFLGCSLHRCKGDVSEVACEMGLTKRSIYLKLCRYGLDPNDYRS